MLDLWIDVFGIDPQQGDTITFPAAGGTHYCWTGVSNNTYYLKFHEGGAQGAGSVTGSA